MPRRLASKAESNRSWSWATLIDAGCTALLTAIAMRFSGGLELRQRRPAYHQERRRAIAHDRRGGRAQAGAWLVADGADDQQAIVDALRLVQDLARCAARPRGCARQDHAG